MLPIINIHSHNAQLWHNNTAFVLPVMNRKVIFTDQSLEQTAHKMFRSEQASSVHTSSYNDDNHTHTMVCLNLASPHRTVHWVIIYKHTHTHTHTLSHKCSAQNRHQVQAVYSGGGGGGFFLACEDSGRMFDHLFPACTFCCCCSVLKWKLARTHNSTPFYNCNKYTNTMFCSEQASLQKCAIVY